MPLEAVSRSDVTRASSKAANLGELLRADHAVPDGFLLTTEAFGALVRQHGFAPDAAADAVAVAALSEAVAEALRQSIVSLDGTVWEDMVSPLQPGLP